MRDLANYATSLRITSRNSVGVCPVFFMKTRVKQGMMPGYPHEIPELQTTISVRPQGTQA